MENCLNQRKLFTACKSLLNLSKCASLPLHSDLNQLMTNDFGKFFRDKINSIRLEIARQGSTSEVSESHLMAPLLLNFVFFRTECLDVLPPPITKLINLSLESGYFPLI